LAKNRIRTSLNELQEFLANETLDDAAELRAAALEAVAEGEAALAEE
jgi:hypothetical protein